MSGMIREILRINLSIAYYDPHVQAANVAVKFRWRVESEAYELCRHTIVNPMVPQDSFFRASND